MKKRIPTKTVTALLCLSMLITLFPLSVKAEGSTRKTIQLQAASLRPEGGVWSKEKGNLLYFGTYVESVTPETTYGPLAYRVLAPSTETQSTGEKDCLFLDCNAGLITEEMAFKENTSVPREPWTYSDLRTWLNGSEFYQKEAAAGVPAVFTELERKAIVETELKSRDNYTAEPEAHMTWRFFDYQSSDYLFLLSAKEVTALYASAAERTKTLFHQTSASNFLPGWWLRSSSNGNNAGAATFVVMLDGAINTGNADHKDGKNLCPAFNVDCGSIAFVSTVEMGKNTSDLLLVEAAAKPDGSALREWKATLFDSSKTVALADGQKAAYSSEDGVRTITVPYQYEGTDVSQISVMITDKEYTEKDAQVLYYGALQGIDLTQTESKSGIGTFTLPDQLPGSVKFYLLAEDVNEGKVTDYTSMPYELSVPRPDLAGSSGSHKHKDAEEDKAETLAPVPEPSELPAEAPKAAETPVTAPAVSENVEDTLKDALEVLEELDAEEEISSEPEEGALESPDLEETQDSDTDVMDTEHSASPMWLIFAVLAVGALSALAIVIRKKRQR